MTKHITPIAKSRDNRYRMHEENFDNLPNNVRAGVLQHVGEYYRCVGDEKSVDLSIRKLDFAPCKDYKDNPYWRQTCDVVTGMWAHRFKDSRFMFLDEILPEMNLDSASGVPWRLLGLNTKRKVLLCVQFMLLILSVHILDQKRPVWTLCPKTEWYAAADLDKGKVRTFIIPPFHLLLWSVMLYKHQNELTKDYWWSAYGFNPYQGGTHRMALELLHASYFLLSYDVSGWDRKLPLMRKIYRLRNAFVQDCFQPFAIWVAENTCYSVILLPDGTFVVKNIGNNSGSGATTGDNILGHCFVAFLALMTLYDGDTNLCIDIVAKLYGDDNIMGLPRPSAHRGLSDEESMWEIERVFREVFLSFGFELDPFNISRDLRDHEFLGFKFARWEDYWIPQYDKGRLAAAFCYTIKSMEDNAIVARCWSLTMMAAGSGEETFHDFALALEWMLNSFRDSDDPIISSYVEIGVPSFEQCMAFYTGLESGITLPSGHFLEEVGRNSLLFSDEWECQN
jgi:hypothetical protein